MNNNSNLHSKLTRSSFIMFAVFGLMMSIIFRVDTSSTAFFLFASFIAFIIIFSVFVIPLKWLIYPVFILIILMPDTGERMFITASLWQFKIGVISPAILIFSFLFIVLLRLYKSTKSNPYNYLFLFLIIVPTFTGLIFGFFHESVQRFISDAKVPVFFITSIIIFRSYYSRFPQNLMISIQIFVSLAIGNFFLNFLELIQSTYVIIGSVSNLSLDSGKGLIEIFIFLAIGNLIEKKNLLLNSFILIISIYLLIAFQTRWLLLTASGGMIIVLFFLGFKKTLKISLPMSFLIIVTILLAIKFVPEVWRVALLRLSFTENLTSKSTLMDIEHIRAGAIYNSINLLWEKKTFLTGMGFGSWYDDSFFSMHGLTEAAFDRDSLRSGKYYRIHDFFFHFLFKYGIIGVSLYVAAFIRPLRQLWKFRFYLLKDYYFRTISVVIYGLCPVVITYMYWTGKGLLFSGLYIVVVYEWVKVIRMAVDKIHIKNV